LSFPNGPISRVGIKSLLLSLVNAFAGSDSVPPSDDRFDRACTSASPVNEHEFYKVIEASQPHDPVDYLGSAFLLLCFLYLRLAHYSAREARSWRLARHGGEKHLALDRFFESLGKHIEIDATALDVLTWLYQDYVIAQHTLTALEKLRDKNRRFDSFRFTIVDGLFYFERDDRPAFTTSRFDQCLSMLIDLGLCEPVDGAGYRITVSGDRVLHRVAKAFQSKVMR
jgi:hypothetical protein